MRGRRGGSAIQSEPTTSAVRTTLLQTVSGLAVVAALALAASCGGGSGDQLSEAGERGRRIATTSGCASCHGLEGQGGVGPTWLGLAGSDVTLLDGTVIVADDVYLARSITDPGADLLADYSLQMPTNRLTDAEVADLVAYINDLREVEED